jgi:hypothetical protein
MDHITLEDIDFDIVQQCNDGKILTKYIQLLKADGGYFQELLSACEHRLKDVDPKLAEKLAPQKIARQVIDESKALLLQWETELRSSASSAIPETFENLAPLRNGKIPVEAARKPAPEVAAVRKGETQYKRDGTQMKDYYDAWDKLDADLTLEEQDEAERQKNVELKKQQDKFTTTYAAVDLTTLVSDHDAELTKGLEALKAGDADEADYFFTRAIQAQLGRSARGFFHRAEARTALEKHREALEDIQTAMALDISLGPIGGFAIRAHLRADIGLFNDAEADFVKAIDSAKDKDSADKFERQLRLLRAKKADEEKNARAQVFTKVSIIEEEEPKIYEIFDEEDVKMTENFTKISVVEEAPTKRRISVQIVEDDDD